MYNIAVVIIEVNIQSTIDYGYYCNTAEIRFDSFIKIYFFYRLKY